MLKKFGINIEYANKKLANIWFKKKKKKIKKIKKRRCVVRKIYLLNKNLWYFRKKNILLNLEKNNKIIELNVFIK